MFFSILEEFNGPITKTRIKEIEDDNCYQISYNVKEFSLEGIERFIDSLYKLIPERDRCNVTISMDDLDPITLSNPGEVSEFKKETEENFLSIADGESEFEIQITIRKKVIDNMLTFYSINYFKKFLFNMDLQKRLGYFNELLDEHGVIHFVIKDSSLENRNLLSTEFFTISWNVDETNLPFLTMNQKRDEIIKRQRTVCNIINDLAPTLIPDDFILKEKSYEDEEILNFVTDSCFALCLGFVFDIVRFESDKLFFKLNGYNLLKEL